MTKRIAIYSRKSIETDKGDSIEVQIQICKNYFSKYDECKFEIFEDEGFSGGNTNRPALQKMLQLVKANEFDIVAVYRVDRIARNVVDFVNMHELLKKYNTNLVSVTEGFDPSNPLGKMMMLILASFAEMERENIRQRVRDNMLALGKKGYWSGGNAPFGYTSVRVTEHGKLVSFLTQKADEVKIVEEVFRMYTDGFSTRKIATYLNFKYNLNTSPKRVSNIIQNPSYTGSSTVIHEFFKNQGYEVYGEPDGYGYLMYGYRKVLDNGNKVLNKDGNIIVAVSKHEPIIDNATWLKAQEIKQCNTQEPKPRISQFTFLAHLVRCGVCGAQGSVYSETRLDGVYRFFRMKCKCKVGKTGKRLTIDDGENYVFEYLKKASLNKKIIEKQFQKPKNSNELDKSILNLKNRINEITNKIDALIEKMVFSSEAVAKLLNEKIEAEIKSKEIITNELFLLEREKTLHNNEYNIDALIAQINYFLANFNEMTMEQKQLAIQKFVKYISWDGAAKRMHVEFKSCN